MSVRERNPKSGMQKAGADGRNGALVENLPADRSRLLAVAGAVR